MNESEEYWREERTTSFVSMCTWHLGARFLYKSYVHAVTGFCPQSQSFTRQLKKT